MGRGQRSWPLLDLSKALPESSGLLQPLLVLVLVHFQLPALQGANHVHRRTFLVLILQHGIHNTLGIIRGQFWGRLPLGPC